MKKVVLFFRSLFEKKLDPETIRYPEVSPNFETSRKNVYIIGELAGIPLLKTALNNGVDVIDHLTTNKTFNNKNDVFDVVIVGLGASGFSASLAAQKAGLNYIVLESDKIFSTIQKFAKGKIILDEPVSIENRSEIWLNETTKEELLEKWISILEDKKINYKLNSTVSNIINEDNDTLKIITKEGQTYKTSVVILAIGKAGNPRKANVLGEEKAKTHYFLDDPDNYSEKDIHIYGGGDVAVECAIALCEKNNVTISTVDEKWIYPRKRNQDIINDLIENNKIQVNFKTKLNKITDKTVSIENTESKEKKEIPNNDSFIMIGGELPISFFKEIKIKLNGTWDAKRWLKLALGMIVSFVIYAFAWKKPPFSNSGNWLSQIFPKGVLQDTFFWYTLLYTVSMLAFGIPSLLKWGKGSNRKNVYQKWRFISLLLFQTFFFFLVPYFIMSDNNFFNLFYAYPLRYDALLNSSTAWTIYAFILAFILIPLFVLYHGKRYCSWICACGVGCKFLTNLFPMFFFLSIVQYRSSFLQ